MFARRWEAELLAVSLATLAAVSTASAGPSSPDAVVRNDSSSPRLILDQPARPESPVADAPAATFDEADETNADETIPAPSVNLAMALPADARSGLSLQDQSPVQNAGAGLWHPGLDADHLAAALPVTSPLSADPVGTSEQPMVPLPTAAWTGMSMLAGLGIIRFARNIRKFLT